jgi:predicted nucleic acid-binding protein
MNSRSVLVEGVIRETSFMNAVDTNVLLYAVDEDEPAKRKRAREFLRQLGRTDEPLLMWQVLGEFLAGLRRWEQQRGHDPQRTRRYLNLAGCAGI